MQATALLVIGFLLAASLASASTLPVSIEDMSSAEVRLLLGDPDNAGQDEHGSHWYYQTPKGLLQLTIVKDRVKLIPPKEPHRHTFRGRTKKELRAEAEELRMAGRLHEAAIAAKECDLLSGRRSICDTLKREIYTEVQRDIDKRFSQIHPTDKLSLVLIYREILELNPNSVEARNGLVRSEAAIIEEKMQAVRSLYGSTLSPAAQEALRIAQDLVLLGKLDEAFSSLAPYWSRIRHTGQDVGISRLAFDQTLRELTATRTVESLDQTIKRASKWLEAMDASDRDQLARRVQEKLPDLLSQSIKSVKGAGVAGARLLAEHLTSSAPYISEAGMMLPWDAVGLTDPVQSIYLTSDYVSDCGTAQTHLKESALEPLGNSFREVSAPPSDIVVTIRELRCDGVTRTAGEEPLNSTYVSTYQQVVNPEYTQLQVEVEQAEAEYRRRLADNERASSNQRVSSALLVAFAGDKVRKLQRKLSEVPPYLREPVTLPYRVTRTHHVKVGTMSAVLEVFDSVTGLRVHEFVEGHAEARATSLSGTLEGDAQGLSDTSPSLPGDAELFSKSAEDLKGQMQNAVGAFLERIYLERASKSKEAVAVLGNVLLARDANPSSSHTSLYARIDAIKNISPHQLSLSQAASIRDAIPRSHIATKSKAPPRIRTAEGGSIDKFASAVVTIEGAAMYGSGFFVDGQGTIITNSHVVDGSDRLIVRTRDGQTFLAKLRKQSRTHDLALLTIAYEPPIFLRLSEGEPALGSDVYAIGAPEQLEWTVTKGIVSALRKMDGVSLIQLDAAINPGNSGGPVILTNGEVVGVATSRRANSESLGFAVATAEIRSVFAGLLTEGSR